MHVFNRKSLNIAIYMCLRWSFQYGSCNQVILLHVCSSILQNRPLPVSSIWKPSVAACLLKRDKFWKKKLKQKTEVLVMMVQHRRCLCMRFFFSGIRVPESQDSVLSQVVHSLRPVNCWELFTRGGGAPFDCAKKLQQAFKKDCQYSKMFRKLPYSRPFFPQLITRSCSEGSVTKLHSHQIAHHLTRNESLEIALQHAIWLKPGAGTLPARSCGLRAYNST